MPPYSLFEYTTDGELRQAESEIDSILARFGMDIEFTRHFKERMDDPRNGKEVTASELIGFFRHAVDKAGGYISHKPVDFEAVLSELSTKLNVPFILDDRDRDGIKELVAKTVMRKPNFQSSNQKITF